jgi:hypothetical protein
MHQLIHNNDGIKILDLLNQSKTPGRCGFPLANPHKGESLHFVPESNPDNILNLLCM